MVGASIAAGIHIKIIKTSAPHLFWRISTFEGALWDHHDGSILVFSALFSHEQQEAFVPHGGGAAVYLTLQPPQHGAYPDAKATGGVLIQPRDRTPVFLNLENHHRECA